MRDGGSISGATGSTYDLVQADVGTQISVQVSYTDGNSTAEGPLTSSQTAAVASTNIAPVASNDADNVNKGSTVVIDLSGNDTDVDNAIDLNSISIITAPANGNLNINGDGTVTYTHDGSETLSDTFIYAISDITGAISNTAIVNITVNALNDNPVAGNDATSVNEGGAVVIDLAGNDIDTDNAIDLNSISIIGAPSNGTLIINGDGTVTYTHDDSETTSDSFSYSISDISGAISNTATVNINVTSQNDVPTTIGITDVSVNEDAPDTMIDLNAAFNDSDNLDTELTYSIVGNTNIGLFTNTNINASTGELTLDYALNMNGSSQISMRATDLAGASVDTLFTVTVSPVNDSPVLDVNTGIAVTTISEMNINNSLLSASDVDNTATEIQYVVTELPGNGALMLNGIAMALNDSFTEDDLINNRISYQVSASPASNDQFMFTVTDGSNVLANKIFNIVIQLGQPLEPDEREELVEPLEPIESVEPVVSITPVAEAVQPVSPATPDEASANDGIEAGFNPASNNSTSPQQQQPLEDIEADEGIDGSYVPVENRELPVYDLNSVNSYPDIQVKSIKALWVAVDKMTQQMSETNTEEIENIKFKADAVSSSGVALTAGVVAWVMRSSALMTSLMSTLPLWKGYDLLPILAYRDDEEEEEEMSEDRIPNSHEELKKTKQHKDKMKPSNRIDSMFDNKEDEG